LIFYQKIKNLIVSGKILDAIELSKGINPLVFSDSKLLFKLYKQQVVGCWWISNACIHSTTQFVELLRQEEVDEAIKLARNCLAPFALDAFPEAYLQFKHTLLMLLYHRKDLSSPVAIEW
jgi:hypothetical protein